VVKNRSANGIFYVEYLNPLVEAGYWDDRDRDAGHNDDGSWIEPVNLGVINVGADYAYEVHATTWLSFLFGGGLDVGFILGDLKEWQAGETPGDADNNNAEVDCGPAPTAAYDRYKTCKVDSYLVKDGTIPPVIPMVDILVGMRFNIADRAAIRLEGGFHYMLYGGASVSVVF
jgi:hypothetical protein